MAPGTKVDLGDTGVTATGLAAAMTDTVMRATAIVMRATATAGIATTMTAPIGTVIAGITTTTMAAGNLSGRMASECHPARSMQTERYDVRARRDRNVVLALETVSDGRCRNLLTRVEEPQRLTCTGIERGESALIVSREEQSTRG